MGMKEKTLTNRESRKLASKRYIMTLIHGEEAVSQTAIVEKTKIRPGTVQAIIEELLEEKLIRVRERVSQRGGEDRFYWKSIRTRTSRLASILMRKESKRVS